MANLPTHTVRSANADARATNAEPGLWQLINQSQHVDARAMRLCCSIFFVVYGAITLVRFDPAHLDLALIRLAMCVHIVIGFWLARGITFAKVRWFTFSVALTLPLSASYIDGVLGNTMNEVVLTALATFIPLVFLQTARDLIAVNACLWVGNLLVLQLVPPPAVGMSTFLLVLGCAKAFGTVVGLNSMIYRARYSHSVDRLEAALASKSEFLNTMSHELRSPLHMIIGYLDLWSDDATDLEPDMLRERMRAGALELLRLVEDTMNVARLDASKVTVRNEQFVLEDLMNEVAEGVRGLPEAKHGVALHWELRNDPAPVCLDRLKLKEIVVNLVSNALKFTREGSVTINFVSDDQALSLDVRDTGVGITPDAQARIFDLFERIEAPHGHQPPGVGLGLYIVKRLVELMEGTVDVASEAGAGTWFSVRLPLAEHRTSALANTAPTPLIGQPELVDESP